MAKPLSEQIIDARKAVGMSQLDLAEALGMTSNSAVNRWERGGHEPRLEAIQRIADITGATFTIEPRAPRKARR